MSKSHERAAQDDVRDLFLHLGLGFIRDRLLGPRQVVAVLMTMIKEQCGYDRGLCLAAERHGKEFGWTQKKGCRRKRRAAPSASAFCRARQNVTPAEMLEAFRTALASPTATAARQRWRWKGMSVTAADGMRMLLPASPSIIAEWRRPLVAGGEAYQPQLLQVTVWDVGAVQPLAWVHVPCRGKGHGERTAILALLDRLEPGSVLLLDRGFPSRHLLHELVARGIHFVIRMTASGKRDFSEVERFLAGRKADAEADFSYADQDVAAPLIERLRLVRRTDRDGTARVLVTDLRDRDKYTRDELFDLYRLRWGIENAFRDLKIRYEGEHFHGTTPQFIEQEIIALMMLMLMESMVEEVAINALPAGERPTGNDQRPKRHNRAALGDRLPNLIAIALCIKAPRRLQGAFSRGIDAMAWSRERVRRPRSCPRVCKSQYGRWRFERKWKGGEMRKSA